MKNKFLQTLLLTTALISSSVSQAMIAEDYEPRKPRDIATLSISQTEVMGPFPPKDPRKNWEWHVAHRREATEKWKKAQKEYDNFIQDYRNKGNAVWNEEGNYTLTLHWNPDRKNLCRKIDETERSVRRWKKKEETAHANFLLEVLHNAEDEKYVRSIHHWMQYPLETQVYETLRTLAQREEDKRKRIVGEQEKEKNCSEQESSSTRQDPPHNASSTVRNGSIPKKRKLKKSDSLSTSKDDVDTSKRTNKGKKSREKGKKLS